MRLTPFVLVVLFAVVLQTVFAALPKTGNGTSTNNKSQKPSVNISQTNSFKKRARGRSAPSLHRNNKLGVRRRQGAGGKRAGGKRSTVSKRIKDVKPNTGSIHLSSRTVNADGKSSQRKKLSILTKPKDLRIGNTGLEKVDLPYNRDEMVANPPNLGYDDSDFLKKTDPSNRFLNGDKDEDDDDNSVAGLPSLLNNRYEKQYPLSNALPNKVSPSKTEEKTRDIDEYGSDEAGDTSMLESSEEDNLMQSDRKLTI
ncbi:hypothetical protein ACQ4LE_003849 [Meloidogyne hapla]